MRCVAFRKRLTIIIQYRRKQFMVNKESIQRSGILTDKSLSFLSFKREFLEKANIFNQIRFVIISMYQITIGIVGNGSYEIRLKQQKS